MSYFNSITQNAIVDPNNTSAVNLASLATFTGISSSTLGVSGIQVAFHADQNCEIYVEQSQDSINWDISDLYNFRVGVGNFGITVQAVNAYYRVRVKNIGSATTTEFRLQSVLCPIVEAMPRSLSEKGNLKVALLENTDVYGFTTENTPTDESRVVIPYRLVGSSFSGSVLDTNYWIGSSGSTSGSVVPSSAKVDITTGSFVSGSSVLQSFRTARYIGGSSNKFRTVMRLPDVGTTGNIRRWGPFNGVDGAFFQLSGTNFSVVTRKAGFDTTVTSGSFNGHYGLTFPLDTNVKTWEIYWTNSKVFFIAGGDLIHTMTANTDTWCDAMNLPIRFENAGSSGSNTNVGMQCRVATIYRLGNSESQPTSYYHAAGTTTGVNLKIGSGNLHSVVFGLCLANAVVTLVDSVNGATPVIFTSGARTVNTDPTAIDFKGLPFFTGLRLIVSGANAIATVIYE